MIQQSVPCARTENNNNNKKVNKVVITVFPVFSELGECVPAHTVLSPQWLLSLSPPVQQWVPLTQAQGRVADYELLRSSGGVGVAPKMKE